MSDLPADRSSPAFAARRADWRNGPVVYQVFVDRFAPPADLAAFRAAVGSHRIVRSWHELPAPGHYDQDLGCYTHELEFWGGDLDGIRARLGYIADLGSDVLYLTPIHAAFTNPPPLAPGAPVYAARCAGGVLRQRARHGGRR